MVCVLQEETAFQQQFIPQFISKEEEPQCGERQREEPPLRQVAESRQEVTAIHARTHTHAHIY